MGLEPCLAVVQVGSDPASSIYIRNKSNACRKVGITSEVFNLPEKVEESKLLDLIEDLNNDPRIDGMLVQLPLPVQINSSRIINSINPLKDVDGFHPYNLGNLLLKTPTLRPCTPHGIMMMLKAISYDFIGKDAVVLGQSNIVGRPMALELLIERCTVTICHSKTRDLVQKISSADLLIVAIGKPRYVLGEWIKPNAVVIDVGINRLADGSICGDVDFDSALPKVSAISPVPGGVGLMTIAALLKNTVQIAKNKKYEKTQDR